MERTLGPFLAAAKGSRRSRAPGSARSFQFRAGIQVGGTTLTCDAVRSGTDLVFLSHARALVAGGRALAPARRAGRQQLLATDATLTLLGRAGQALRRQALPAAFGRPFSLGELRIELVSAGHLPGSASLLCETGGRRLLYAGTVTRGVPGFGALPAETRSADALCLDATFGGARFVFPPRAQALADLEHFVAQTLALGRAPVILTFPYGGAMEVADVLHRQGHPLRGHRSIVEAATAFRAAGATPPVIPRFARKLTPGEVLLWSPEARHAPLLGGLIAPRFAFASGHCLDPLINERMQADVAIPVVNQSGHADLLAYIEETGAREVALHRGCAEELAVILRGRGLNAYALAPPHQMDLLAG